MTEARANEIFKTKYPEGEICRKNSTSAESKYWVTFKREGKVYYYSGASYQQLLEKLGFPIAYKSNIKNIENQIADYTKQLENLKNGTKPILFNIFGDESDREATENEIAFLKEQIEQKKERLRHLTEECIIA